MSNRVLSLALKITGDASGVRLTPVERALQRLGEETDKVGKVFNKFAQDSEAGQRAQAKFADDSQRLTEALKAGTINSREYAEQFAVLAEAANKEAAALERAARITEANQTNFDRFTRTQRELKEQVDAGRISQETYNRALESAAKGLTDAERAAVGLGTAQKGIEQSASQTALKFNELSGVFSVLPGPLGNIAGRISGISSASEGLGRIFSGGLQSGISGLVGSFTALLNPVSLALAGVTAFAAAANAIAQGLIALEDRVERLGRLANQLGVSFEFVQVLEEAGNRADVSVEQLSGSFARLQNTLAGADEESKKAAAALQGLGVSVSDFGALSEEQRIELIGEKLAQIEDPAQRSAAAIALFGRSGVQLLPFFNELDVAASDMERFGRSVTDLDRQRLAEFGGGIDALSLATSGLGTSLLLPFTGLGEGIATGLAEVTAGITAIVDPIGRILQPAFDNIGRVVEAIGVSLGTLGRIVGAVFEPFAAVVQEVYAAVEPLFDALLDLQRSIGDGIVSTIEWLQSFLPLKEISAAMQVLGQTISRVVTIITTVFGKVGEVIGGVIGWFTRLSEQNSIVQGIGQVISTVFQTIYDVISAIVGAIGGFFGSIIGLAERFLGIDSSAAKAAESTTKLAEEVEVLTEEEKKAAAEREKFLQGFTDNVSKAIDESAKFGQSGFDAALQYQNSIADLQKKFDQGILNEESFKREAEKASAAYTAQIDVIRQAAAETEAITKRVDGLLAKANELPQATQDLNAVEAEIARVQAAIVAARAEGQSQQADALVARLAQLDQLQAGLQEQADQTAQGFDKGFEEAFASVDSGISSLIDKASEFGNQGAAAALQLQEGIAAAQEQVRDGILNREAFEAEVARQKQLFEDRVKDLQRAEKLGEDITKRQDELRKREFDVALARARELADVRSGAVQIQDIRSGGISAFFDTLKEDPAIAEAKKTNKELAEIRKGINKLEAEKIDILAGTG